MKWESPWGLSYPGWHIECSGISIKYLGENLDIHCGAEDAVFPHHTNEIAQSECYLGHKWCNYWVHFGFLNDKNGKMSKSKGEFLTVSVLEEKGYNPLAYRYLCLNSYYHNALTFSYEILDGAEREYLKLKNKVLSLKEDGEIDTDKFNSYDNKFKEALNNNLNTSMCLTILYDVLKDNSINESTKISLVQKFDTVLSLDLLKENTYLDYLKLEDYFILGLELYMSEHDYDDLKVYHFKDIIQDIKNQIKPDLREIERIDFKNIAQSFKDLTNHQILKNYLSYFINKKEEHLNYENLFLKEFVLAMFITCVLSYEVS